MLDTYLVPQATVTAKGDGAAVDVSAAPSRMFLLLLAITRIVEQESLEISLFGSADGTNWTPKPVAGYPQMFYPGEHPMLLDLTGQNDVKFLRAHWDVNRWGRGSLTPMFEFSLKLTEVPPEILREARHKPTV
jgi:hypothetical protein